MDGPAASHVAAAATPGMSPEALRHRVASKGKLVTVTVALIPGVQIQHTMFRYHYVRRPCAEYVEEYSIPDYVAHMQVSNSHRVLDAQQVEAVLQMFTAAQQTRVTHQATVRAAEHAVHTASLPLTVTVTVAAVQVTWERAACAGRCGRA